MTNEKTRLSWFNSKSLSSVGNEDLFYIVGWSLVFVMPIGHRFYEMSIGLTDGMQWRWVFEDWFTILPFLLLFFLSKWVLEPKFFFRQRIRDFIFLSLLSAFVVMYSFAMYSVRHIPSFVKERIAYIEESNNIKIDPPFRSLSSPIGILLSGPFVSMFTMGVLVMSTSLGINIVFRTRREALLKRAEEAQKIKSELDYLKFQINPHFFMNTLNNIHALVDLDSQLAKDAIIELSRLMRYMLYETTVPTVSLHKELEFQRHFIELMRLRYDDTVTVNYEVPPVGSPCRNIQIPPLIGIVFLENAFKYGVSHREPSFITLRYTVESDKFLHMHCSNSNFYEEGAHRQASGLGLVNIRKRLDLLYEDRYKLDIQNTGKEFLVDLVIPIQVKQTSLT